MDKEDVDKREEEWKKAGWYPCPECEHYRRVITELKVTNTALTEHVDELQSMLNDTEALAQDQATTLMQYETARKDFERAVKDAAWGPDKTMQEENSKVVPFIRNNGGHK